MSQDDNFIDPLEPAAPHSHWATLNQADEVGEAELFASASYIYSHLVAVPRSFHEQQLLDMRFQELGYVDTTHALQVGAVQAAFNMRDAIKKRLEKEGGVPNE